ncbi:cohesin complex subunit [Elasticomyces elasticus]|nr:cohesin complex subunit [Elasticomyces elasticus]KAK3641664.1 cohesin complex subunit [Elasticomyces elasticus]KAK4907985.1 cohesin complex subunit [Elasticomyces elasticus]KAK5739482.1 cohesin complex subunit [Elasticomyces elasticus]
MRVLIFRSARNGCKSRHERVVGSDPSSTPIYLDLRAYAAYRLGSHRSIPQTDDITTVMPGRLVATSQTALQDMSASALNKRASGRVRKQPEVYASSPFTSSGKRKRNDVDDAEDDDGDREMPDDYESDEEEVEEAEDEPAEEEIREQNKKARKPKAAATKKPAQKKTKVSGASLPFRAAAAPKKRAPRKGKAVSAVDAEAVGGLYAEVFASGASLDDVVGGVLKRFENNDMSALAEIVNFVLRCTGCTGEVDVHDIEDSDSITNKLEDLREEYQASKPTEYPLVAKGKGAGAFKQALVSFFTALVKAVAVKGVLFDNPILMEHVQLWISTMSSAPERSFRHTATLMSLTIMSALCAVAREYTDESAKFQRQAEAEKKKSRVNKDRVKLIEQNAKDKMQALETIEPMLKDWFDVVFIHRYRDIDALIRRDCVAALGDWIVTLPDMFFDGQHLRYLGWVLSDPAPATRGEVIKQLHRVYKNKDLLGGLKTFTEKFRPRLVEVGTMDAELNVRVSGIELLDILRENGLLEPDDIDAVGRMLFDSDLRVRKAVAAFFAESVVDLYSAKIDELGGLESLEENLPEISDDNTDAPRLEWLKYKSLAEMLGNYDADDNLPSQIERTKGDGGLTIDLGGSDSRFTLATEVLYEKTKEIKDWRALAGYLLFDHSDSGANGVADDALSQLKHETVLSEKEEAILLEVLNASAKRTLSDLAEQMKAPKTKLTARQRERFEEEQEEAARHLSSLVPKLLKKFGDVPSTAAAVLRVEAVLSLPSLRDMQQDSVAYSALLDDVRKQFMSHGTNEVLAPASNAILHAKSYDELDDMTEEKIAALWEDVTSNFSELLNPETVTVRGASQFEELTALSNNLLRIIRLAIVSDCIPSLESSVPTSSSADTEGYSGIIDFIIALVQRAQPSSGPAPDADEAALEDEVAVRAADAGLIYLRWKVKGISATINSSNSGVSMEELEALATRRDNYVTNLHLSLEARKPSEEISVVLAGILLEMYNTAAILRQLKPRAGVSDDYTILAMNFTTDQQRLILRVFAACEKNFAKLSGKKLEDAAVEEEDVEDVDEDPMSDPESDDEEEEATQTQTQTQTQAVQQRRDAKTLHTLRAEQQLCGLTGRIIHSYYAGVLETASVQTRLERNKTKLGQNFKEVVAYLDLESAIIKGKGKKAKAKGKDKPTVNGRKGKVHPKSNAIVAEDEMDDEIEEADADDDDALRRRELLDEPELEQEEEAVDGAPAEEESVMGD